MRVAFLLLVAMAVSKPALACNICGCGGNSLYMGMIPHYKSHMLALRVQQMHFTIYDPHLSTADARILHSEDYFVRTELWGRFRLSPKWFVHATVPMVWIGRKVENMEWNSGFGDAELMLNRTLFSTGDSIMQPVRHHLSMSLGVKLPTGVHQLNNTLEWLQPGSGTWDYLGLLHYNMRIGRWGMTQDVSFRFNTADQYQYQRGHRLLLNTSAYYQWPAGNVVLLPTAGVQYDHLGKDHSYKYAEAFTGGAALQGQCGMHLYFSRGGIGLSYQVPLWQNLNEGWSQQHDQWQFQFSFSF